uniref:Groucho/TLE N-terminal Q-rich domain-containing protein n=1 Tax=Hucho hucho TaxID=62062 RepID=A0A4W5QF93_9TELE
SKKDTFKMYPQGRHPAPHQPGQPGFKFTVAESCDRIKDEFQFLQAQYHSLKVEYDKLANEKTEMQRHYVMVRISHYIQRSNVRLLITGRDGRGFVMGRGGS